VLVVVVEAAVALRAERDDVVVDVVSAPAAFADEVGAFKRIAGSTGRDVSTGAAPAFEGDLHHACLFGDDPTRRLRH
jgi:hypothetical protein